MVLSKSLHVVTEDFKGCEHLMIGVMGIAPARIWQEKDLRPSQLFVGGSKVERAVRRFFGRKEHAKNCDTQESDDGRLVASDFVFQVCDALLILNGIEILYAGGIAGDDIREAEAPFG